MATIRKTRSDLNIFYGWLQAESHNDYRQIESIPPDELDELLSEMYTSLKPRDGGEYDPKSLKSVRNSLERYLRDTGYPVSTVAADTFPKSQAAYKKRIQDIKGCAFLTKVELVALKNKTFDADLSKPYSLLIAMFWITSFYFGDSLVNKMDHFNLLWGDVQLVTKKDGTECLFLTANASRSKPGKHPVNPSAFEASANTENPRFCPVRVYKMYADQRSPSCSPHSKFYSQPGEIEVGPTQASMRLVSSILKAMKYRAVDCLSQTEPSVHVPFSQASV